MVGIEINLLTARTGQKAGVVAMAVERHGSAIKSTGQFGLGTSSVDRGCAVGDRFMAYFAQLTGSTVRMAIYGG